MQVNVFLGIVGFAVAINVDFVARQFAGQLDVVATLADGEADLVVLHVHVGHRIVAAEDDVRNLGRTEGAGDEQRRVGGPVDDVDVLVAQLADDAVNTSTLHADAGTDGVDTVIVTLNGNLSALTGFADNLLDRDKAVVNLGHLGFEQALQEDFGGARKRDHWRAIDALHALHDGAEGVTFIIFVFGNLFRLGQNQFDAFVVGNDDFAFPSMKHLGSDDFANLLLVLLEDVFLLIFRNFGLQILAQGQNVAATETLDAQFFIHFFSHLKIGLNLDGVRQFDLAERVGQFVVLNHGAVVVDFKVALVDVHDDVDEVGGVGVELLVQHATEHILDDAHHGLAVNVLELLEF